MCFLDKYGTLSDDLCVRCCGCEIREGDFMNVCSVEEKDEKLVITLSGRNSKQWLEYVQYLWQKEYRHKNVIVKSQIKFEED